MLVYIKRQIGACVCCDSFEIHNSLQNKTLKYFCSTKINKTMAQYELDRAILEYDFAKSNIQQTKVFGYEIQLIKYNIICSNTTKHKETDKLGVCFQTDFLNETYKDFLENQRPIEPALKKIKDWFDKLLINQKETIDWDRMFALNTENLGELLRTHNDVMPHSIYWKMVANCYTCSSLAHTDESTILKYLNDTRPEKENLMDEEERKFFNNLPDKVTIYRGCSKEEIKSGKFRISWTLDRKVAEFFAFKYINMNHEKSLEKDKSLYDIIEKNVDKKDLLCYFGSRNEAEVLYIPNK